MANNKNLASSKLARVLEEKRLIKVKYTPKGQFSHVYYGDLDFNCNAKMSSSDILELLQAIEQGQNDIITSMSMSASESKQLQKEHARSRGNQKRTNVKSSINKKDTCMPETDCLTDDDLKDLLFDFNNDLILIRQDKIDLVSEWYNDFIDYKINWNSPDIIKVNEDKFITQFNLDKIDKLMSRLERVLEEMKSNKRIWGV